MDVSAVLSALQAAKHRRCLVRRVAVESLTELAPPDLIELLLTALGDRCWEVRVTALEGLELTLAGQGKGPSAVIDLLNDPSHLVRVQAAEAAGEIGLREALTSLRRRLGDDCDSVAIQISSPLSSCRAPIALPASYPVTESAAASIEDS